MFGAFWEQTARYLSSLLSQLTCACFDSKFFLFFLTFLKKKKNKKRQRERERRYTTTPTTAIYIMGLKFVIKQRPAAQDDENENEGEESTKEEELSNVSLC